MGACSGQTNQKSILLSRRVFPNGQIEEARWKSLVKETAVCGKKHLNTQKEYQDIAGLKLIMEDTPYVKTIEVHLDDKLIYGY